MKLILAIIKYNCTNQSMLWLVIKNDLGISFSIVST
jgi:hypothetical protein